MTTEVHGLAGYYGSAGGALAAALIRRRLVALWPNLRGQTILGIGHAAPYLGPWRAEAYRTLALTPEQSAVEPGPGALVADEARLPFADCSMDRVLLVHGLEAAENARRMLREVWRVLADDGRLIVVAPNRMGLWAQLERTPFGHGQPYSPGQLARLLARHLFRVERRDGALFLPPYGLRFLAGIAPGWEAVGRTLCPGFAGVTIMEAEKDMFAAAPAGAVTLRRRILVEIG